MGIWSPTENFKTYWRKTSSPYNILTHISFTHIFWALVLQSVFRVKYTLQQLSSASASFQSQQVSPKKDVQTSIARHSDSSLPLPPLGLFPCLRILRCLCSHALEQHQLLSLTPLGEKRYEVNSQGLQGWRYRVSRAHVSTWTARWNQFGVLSNWFSTVPFTEQRRRNVASCWLTVSSTLCPQSPVQTNRPLPTKREGKTTSAEAEDVNERTTSLWKISTSKSIQQNNQQKVSYQTNWENLRK